MPEAEGWGQLLRRTCNKPNYTCQSITKKKNSLWGEGVLKISYKKVDYSIDIWQLNMYIYSCKCKEEQLWIDRPTLLNWKKSKTTLQFYEICLFVVDNVFWIFLFFWRGGGLFYGQWDRVIEGLITWSLKFNSICFVLSFFKRKMSWFD